MSILSHNQWFIFLGGVILMIVFFLGIRIVPKSHRGIIELLGKYVKSVKPGIHWIVPGVERIVNINVGDQMIYTNIQDIITYDKHNVRVGALVYFKINGDEAGIKRFRYAKNKYYEWGIIDLAQRTLRKLIEKINLNSLQSGDSMINEMLEKEMSYKELNSGIDIIRLDVRVLDWQTDEYCLNMINRQG